MKESEAMGRLAAIFIALVVSASFLCRAQTRTQRPFGAGMYDVALDLTEPYQATVRATLSVTDGQLFTVAHARGFQWSSDIKYLRAYSNEGSEIPLTFVAPNHWRFSTLPSETIRVAYDVDLSCTKSVAETRRHCRQSFDNKLYIVNEALFVMSDASGERTVHFVVPASFKIGSRLTQIAALTYAAPGNRELVSSTTVVERLPIEPVRRQGAALSKTSGAKSYGFCCTRLSLIGR
ncbi:MAG: hypothetical protein WBW87_10215 [Candidatus Cybelea sp.]